MKTYNMTRERSSNDKIPLAPAAFLLSPPLPRMPDESKGRITLPLTPLSPRILHQRCFSEPGCGGSSGAGTARADLRAGASSWPVRRAQRHHCVPVRAKLPARLRYSVQPPLPILTPKRSPPARVPRTHTLIHAPLPIIASRGCLQRQRCAAVALLGQRSVGRRWEHDVRARAPGARLHPGADCVAVRVNVSPVHQRRAPVGYAAAPRADGVVSSSFAGCMGTRSSSHVASCASMDSRANARGRFAVGVQRRAALGRSKKGQVRLRHGAPGGRLRVRLAAGAVPHVLTRLLRPRVWRLLWRRW